MELNLGLLHLLDPLQELLAVDPGHQAGVRDTSRRSHPLSAYHDIIVAKELPSVELDQFKCTVHFCLSESLLIALLRIGIGLGGALGALVSEGGVDDLLVERLDLLLQRALVRTNQFVQLHRVLLFDRHALCQQELS